MHRERERERGGVRERGEGSTKARTIKNKKKRERNPSKSLKQVLANLYFCNIRKKEKLPKKKKEKKERECGRVCILICLYNFISVGLRSAMNCSY